MKEIKRPHIAYQKYHAHVYFDRSTLAHASSICEEAGRLFGVKVGRIHEKPIGPHASWSCQLAFDANQFDQLIPWLEKHRESLSVLVHGMSDNHLEDHTHNAIWLGEPMPLNLSVFDS